MVGLTLPIPLKILVPPLTVTFDFIVGLDDAETTRVLPPLAGVLKANVWSPLVKEYQVFLLHDEAE